jgi:hypothetical protein
MFNHGLQATVSGLATEVSNLLASTPGVRARARSGGCGRAGPGSPGESGLSPAQTTPSAPGPAAPPERASSAGTDADAVLAALGRLGDLHQRGILTDEEFAAKKAGLLSRL